MVSSDADSWNGFWEQDRHYGGSFKHCCVTTASWTILTSRLLLTMAVCGVEIMEAFLKLCWSVLSHSCARVDEGSASLLSGFHRPTYHSQWHTTRKSLVNKWLMRVTFDLILLRRWVWFGQWRSAMSAECECLSRSYELCACGRHAEGQRLAKAVSQLMSSKPHPPALLV